MTKQGKQNKRTSEVHYFLWLQDTLTIPATGFFSLQYMRINWEVQRDLRIACTATPLKWKSWGEENKDFSQRPRYGISLNKATLIIHLMMLPVTLNNTIYLFLAWHKSHVQRNVIQENAVGRRFPREVELRGFPWLSGHAIAAVRMPVVHPFWMTPRSLNLRLPLDRRRLHSRATQRHGNAPRFVVRRAASCARCQ